MSYQPGSIEAAKGDFGELLAIDRLKRAQWTVYRRDPDCDGGHIVDLFAHRWGDDVIAIDAKAKVRRTVYCDTGINFSHYEKYKSMKVDTLLLFIDHEAHILSSQWRRNIHVFNRPCCYGGLLSELDNKAHAHEGYPWHHGGQIYWPLAVMDHEFDLTDEEVRKLVTMSRRPSMNAFYLSSL